MGSKFGGQYPAVSKEGRRDNLMFLAAAGLAFSLLVILFLVNHKPSEANPVAEQPAVNTPAVIGTVTLFVADRFIHRGTELKEEYFKDVYWPRSTVPDGAVRDLSEIRSKFAKADIKSGEPLRRADLSSERKIAALPITPGMRAVTIEVDAQAGLEGWALPGTSVDVALTYMAEGNLTSKVIVQNAKVLSYAGSAVTAEERIGGARRKVSAGSTITLEVSPSDALTISTSKALGTLSLLMRAPEDHTATPVVEVNRHTIDGGNSNKVRRKDCNRGVMRIEGREYLIGCNGTITQMGSMDEP